VKPGPGREQAVLRWLFMQLSEIFLGQGEPQFTDLLRGISIGKLKTYQLYDRMKVRLHLGKLNSENLRKAAPKFWARLGEKDEEFASELAQAILVSHLDMIKAVLDDLGIPNQDGFFDKDIDGSKYFTEGWQHKTFEKFKETYPPAVLLFYINHLDWEVSKAEKIFQPGA
jgi:hypothetical protein